MLTLIGESFSPWTEKARWALDHHRLAYGYREHFPLIGEPLLRFRAKRLTGRASVPLLLTDEGPLPDSFAIARRAEQLGRGASLFPPEREREIAEWNARSEAALASARLLYLDRVARDREARIEMQPPFIPRALRAASLPVTEIAIHFLRRKYGIDAAGARTAEAALLREFEGVRAALDGRRYLLDDRFSYADVTIAVTLQFVSPPAPHFLELGPATRASCHAPELAAQIGDLIAWRDALYERHRSA